MGIDKWNTAIETYNYNFNLSLNCLDVLSIENSIDSIEKFPDTNVIIGGPPCNQFSNSNKSGKSDKAIGLRLIEFFLRTVVIKKHKKNSILEAWFMENVPNVLKHIKKKYTYYDLNLVEWAKENSINPKRIAINIENNNLLINAVDHGVPQNRKRVIIGEYLIKSASVKSLKNVLSNNNNKNDLELKLKNLRSKIPSPFTKNKLERFEDPNYKGFTFKLNDISDHFYDTGLYEWQWKECKFLKTNHPYMGKMSFPENGNNPSRTVIALQIPSSRELIVYESELKRKGDGEYRSLTIREAATLMGFPYCYQFIGTKRNKQILIGNSVCPPIGFSLATHFLKLKGLKPRKTPKINKSIKAQEQNNFNTFKVSKFEDRQNRRKMSTFRKHAFKGSSITVTLSNHNITYIRDDRILKWYTSLQIGIGESFKNIIIPDGFFRKIENQISNFKKGHDFLRIIKNGFLSKVSNKSKMQQLYEEHRSENGLQNPWDLVDDLGIIINSLYLEPRIIDFKLNIKGEKFHKSDFPSKHLFALYGINSITTKVNNYE